MSEKRKSIIAMLVVLIFGAALFYLGTDGFTAFTAETARVNKLIDEKPNFPQVTFEDSESRTYSIEEFKGKYVLITFIYTSCTTVCIDLEMNMSDVYDRIPSKYIGEDLMFLSISFDSKRDDPKTLNVYKDIFTNSDGETWRMARIKNSDELDLLLKEFGVIVIPDEYGNFAHNSAFYLIDREGVLQKVMDYKKVEEAAERIRRILEDDGGV